MCYKLSIQTPIATPRVRRADSRPRVGVRELRQNLSVYLERVVAGERFDVTDRGQVVAMLIPSAPAATLLDRLIADGRATPPSQDRDSRRAGPPVKVTAAERRRIWEAYEATRADGR